MPFGDVLASDSLIQILEEETPEFRDRVYPPVVTLSAFLGQVLSDDHSCQEAVSRVLAERVEQGEAPCSPGTSAYCQARKRLPKKLIFRLLRETGKRLHDGTPPPWQWKGRKVVLADGSTVSMSDTPENQAAYPQPESQKPGLGFPLARLVVLISLAVGGVLDVAIETYQGKETGEHALLRQILDALDAGDVLIADRYYCSYFLIAVLQLMGVDMVFQNHASRKVDFRKGQRLGKRDHVVAWSKPARPDWMDQETYAAMPATLTVRETKVAGRVLVSTFLDPKEVHREELGDLYRRRWEVEIDLKFIKQVLHMDILRGRTPEMVRKEIGVHLLGYNLIRTVMAQAANRHGLAPHTISFKGAVQLLNSFREKIDHASGKKLIRILAALLRAIAYHRIGDRPGRVEPRAVKRRPKPFPLLTVPRAESRSLLSSGGFEAI